MKMKGIHIHWFFVIVMVGLLLPLSVRGGEMPMAETITGTTSIEEGLGKDSFRTTYISAERFIIDERGKKNVVSSWIDGLNMGNPNYLPYGVKRILKNGDDIPGYGVVGGLWNVSPVCTRRDDSHVCREHAIVVGMWTESKSLEESVSGLFLVDPLHKTAKPIIRVGEEFPGSSMTGQRNFVWSVYNPRATDVRHTIFSGGVPTGVDHQLFVVTEGLCGPSQAEATHCLMAYIEYDARTKRGLYFVARDGMPELGGGILSRSWNVTFYSPGITDGSRVATRGPLSDVGLVFSVVRTDAKGIETERPFVAILTEYSGIANIAELCVDNLGSGGYSSSWCSSTLGKTD